MEKSEEMAIQYFYESILENESKRLNLKLQKVLSKEDLKQFIKFEIMPLVRSKKLDITEEDLLEYEKESVEKLKKDDLLNVSGGVSPKSFILAGGIASLAMLALGATNNLSAHAAVDREVVLESTEELKKEDDSQKKTGQEDKGKEKESKTISPQQQSQEGTEASTSVDTATVSAPIAAAAAPETPVLKMKDEEASVAQDSEKANSGLPTEAVLASAAELTKKQSQTDTPYIAQALNLPAAYVLNMTGTTENFRIFDGSKQEVVAGKPGGDGVPSWDFKKDSGAGSADFMSILCPSSGGVLNTEGGAPDMPCFSKDCEPTPELVAKMAAYIYNHIVNGTQEDSQELQDTLASIQEVDLKNYTKLKELANIKAEIEELVKKSEQQKKAEAKKQRPFSIFSQMVDSGDVPARQLMGRLNAVYSSLKGKALKDGENVDVTKYQYLLSSYSESLQSAQQIDRFFSEKLHIGDITKTIKDQDPIKQKKALTTTLRLLDSARIMKTKQEYSGSEYDPASPEKVLPAFTTERMFMSYFAMHFNTKEDVQKFYKEVRQRIKTSHAVDRERLQNSLDHVTQIGHIIRELKSSSSSPYKGATLENGSTKAISGADANGKVKFFANDIFADCADIAARHVMNLLTYSVNDDWSSVLGDSSPERLEEELNTVLSAMESGQAIDFKPLKERLQLFFYHQSKVGVDAGDISTRSLWNYVISNMDKNLEPGMYKIKYVGNKNYELETGFLNAIKLIYNMAFSLHESEPSSHEKFTKAQTAIAALESTIENGETGALKEKLKLAIESTFKLINDSINLKDVTSDIELQQEDTGKDCFGKIEIQLKGKSSPVNFKLMENPGHGSVSHQALTPFTKEFIEQNKKILDNNEFARVFVSKFSDERAKYSPDLSIFYRLFIDHIDKLNGFEKSQYFANYQALKFLKAVQGEANNWGRLIEEIRKFFPSLECNILIKTNKIKEDLILFVFKNYIPKTNQTTELFFKIWEICADKNPQNVVEINDQKFYCDVNEDEISATICPIGNNSISELTIPSKVSIGQKEYQVSGIGKLAFKLYADLKAVRFSEGIQTLKIGQSTFSGSILHEFILPETLTSLNISEDAFSYSQIQEFKVPKNVTSLSIGYGAFRESSLQQFILPEALTSLNIGRGAFSETQIQEFKVPKNVISLSIGNFAFSNSPLQQFILPETLTSLNIGDSAFQMTQIQEFKVPKKVTSLSIRDSAFSSSSLQQFILPEALTSLSIGEGAFQMTQIQEFKVPKNVTSLTIGDMAFIGASELQSFQMDKNPKNLTMGTKIFKDCKKLIKNDLNPWSTWLWSWLPWNWLW